MISPENFKKRMEDPTFAAGYYKNQAEVYAQKYIALREWIDSVPSICEPPSDAELNKRILKRICGIGVHPKEYKVFKPEGEVNKFMNNHDGWFLLLGVVIGMGLDYILNWRGK